MAYEQCIVCQSFSVFVWYGCQNKNPPTGRKLALEKLQKLRLTEIRINFNQGQAWWEQDLSLASAFKLWQLMFTEVK